MNKEQNLTASEHAKKEGLPSLKVASKICGESTQTLNNWLKNKPFVFSAVIKKAGEEFKESQEM